MEELTSRKKLKRGRDTREKIIEEAIDFFYQYGFTRASTRQLVRRVGMTSSAIYNHFTNKEEILFTIIQRAGVRVLDTLNDAIKGYDEPEECLKQMITRMLALFKEREMRKVIAIFIDELYQLPEDLRETCNQQHRQIFHLFLKKIREIKKQKGINPMNDKVAAFGMIGAMNWVYHWYRDNGPLSIEDIADDLVKLLFGGLMGADKCTESKEKRKPKK
ncbi:MAG: TetR/AcrR family transcriptional regulator [Thermodesulfobacteriota bacterium]|nr:TetR/AcrR family transcriptional regulator [Thermodesulfobacteriota bacterium]